MVKAGSNKVPIKKPSVRQLTGEEAEVANLPDSVHNQQKPDKPTAAELLAEIKQRHSAGFVERPSESEANARESLAEDQDEADIGQRALDSDEFNDECEETTVKWRITDPEDKSPAKPERKQWANVDQSHEVPVGKSHQLEASKQIEVAENSDGAYSSEGQDPQEEQKEIELRKSQILEQVGFDGSDNEAYSEEEELRDDLSMSDSSERDRKFFGDDDYTIESRRPSMSGTM